MIHRNEFPSEIPPMVGVDIECTCNSGLSKLYLDEIVLVQVAAGDDVYVLDKQGQRMHRDKLAALLSDRAVVKVFHNSTFDMGFLKVAGFGVIGPVWDTMLAERVLTAGTGEACDLAATSWRRISKQVDKSLQRTFRSHRVSKEQVEYAARDAEVLGGIREAQVEALKRESLVYVADLENELAPAVAAMEVRGIGFDVDKWLGLSEKLGQERDELNKEIQKEFKLDSYAVDFWGDLTGINLNSWQQILDALAGLGINLPNTKARTFEGHIARYPNCSILRDILRWRGLDTKIAFRYHDYVNSATGRIHARFNQLGRMEGSSRSGRFTSSNPNLQNPPRDQRVRSCFVAAPGRLLATLDYSQEEMRIMAQASGDKRLIEVCCNDDVHAANARVMYKDRSIRKGDKRRTVAKSAGFAWMYGSGTETLAYTAGISLRDAEEAMRELELSYPDVEKWGKRQLRHLHQEGWIQTLMGRKRWIPSAQGSPEIGKFSRIATNTPIQGTGADIMKAALVEIDKVPGADIVSCVHDEVVVETDVGIAEQVAEQVAVCMVKAGEKWITKVPVVVDYKIGKTWAKP